MIRSSQHMDVRSLFAKEGVVRARRSARAGWEAGGGAVRQLVDDRRCRTVSYKPICRMKRLAGIAFMPRPVPVPPIITNRPSPHFIIGTPEHLAHHADHVCIVDTVIGVAYHARIVVRD